MLMYDVVHRDTAKRKRTDAKEERRQLIKDGVIDPELEAEVKKLKREQEQDLLYQREERKLLLGRHTYVVILGPFSVKWLHILWTQDNLQKEM